MELKYTLLSEAKTKNKQTQTFHPVFTENGFAVQSMLGVVSLKNTPSSNNALPKNTTQ